MVNLKVEIEKNLTPGDTDTAEGMAYDVLKNTIELLIGDYMGNLSMDVEFIPKDKFTHEDKNLYFMLSTAGINGLRYYIYIGDTFQMVIENVTPNNESIECSSYSVYTS